MHSPTHMHTDLSLIKHLRVVELVERQIEGAEMLTGKRKFCLGVGGIVARTRWQKGTQQQVYRAAADTT